MFFELFTSGSVLLMDIKIGHIDTVNVVIFTWMNLQLS